MRAAAAPRSAAYPGRGRPGPPSGPAHRGGCGGRSRRSRRRTTRHHHHARADLDPVEQVRDVLVQHADAAGGDELADRRGLVGAVDAVDGRAEIHRAGAERIAGAAGHEARQIGLALDHLGRRMPIRPLGLAGDLLHPGPGEAVAADADAVTNRAAIAEDVVQIGVRGIDDDRSGRLLGRERDLLAAQVRRQLCRRGVGLLLGRERGDRHRPAIGANRRLPCLDRSGRGGTTDGFRRTQAVAAGGLLSGTVGIDHSGRAGGAAVAGIVGRHHRPLRRRSRVDGSAGGTAITGIIRRHHRPLRRRSRIDRRTSGAAVAGIVGRDRTARAGRRQRCLRQRVVVIFQRVETRRAVAGAVFSRSAVARRLLDRIALGLCERGSRRSDCCGSAYRQKMFDHHRSCIVPRPYRTANGQMTEDSGTFKTLQADLRRICRFVIRKTTVAPLHHGGGNRIPPWIAGVIDPDFKGTARRGCDMFESA
ncbi:hypothetical protein NK6_1558 [Bradyrhizobium diazoefficiens]|uniref:Uncharacterized protein n=1 Tax=Bradyrhizobium diazoefficiens TaxID=1355477 RepID=A0A0E4BLG5_9BRAD|nr:hypothetical protein NK6_1558 [Bradyrhizobium diazoefficiens]